MNTIDRATVEQALEAMLNFPDDISDEMFESITALKAALAQQAEPVTVDAAYQKWLEGTHAPALRRMDSQGAFAAGWQAALAQQAEPVEPYCYVYEYDGVFGLHREFYPLPYNGMKPSRTVPVYTAPLQRKPLTEEEIEACRQQGYAHGGLHAPFDFGKAARAVERKVRGEEK